MSNLPKNKDEISTSLSSTDLFFKVMHHFGDWELETAHLTRLEKSIYFDMRTLYLRQGEPLSDDIVKLERYLKCVTDDEKQALQFVLADKFSHCPKRKAYKHKGWDLQIKAYKYKLSKKTATNANKEVTDEVTDKITAGNGRSNEFGNDKKALSNAERQARYKERKRMLKALFDKGIGVDNNADFWQVCQVYIENFPTNSDKKSNETNDKVTTGNEQNNAKNGAITKNLLTYEPMNESERATVTQNHTDTAPVPAHARTHNFQNQSNVKNQSTINNTQSSNQKFGNKPISLPDDFKFTKEHLQKCQSLGFDIEKLFEHFKNHCRSKNKQSHDWDSEFMIWINREQSFVRPAASPQPASWQNQNSATDPYAGLSYTEVLAKDRGEDMVVRMTAEEKEASDKAAAEFFANFRTKHKQVQLN